MNDRWIYLLIILRLLLSFVGCTATPQEEPTDVTPPPTVGEDIFTAPTETEAPTSGDDANPEAALSREEWATSFRSRGYGMSFGFHFENDESSSFAYQGGEANIQFTMDHNGFEGLGIGVVLCLDGQVQPYRTADGDTYSYMHTYYQEDGVKTVHDIYFVPVAGQTGDTLNMQIMCVAWPDYFLNNGYCALTHTSGTTGSAAHLIFEATPPEQELPEVKDRLASYTMEYVDLKSHEISGWTAEDLRVRIEEHCRLLNKVDGGDIYKFTADDSVEFRYETWGNPAGEYSFVLFVDNQPVSIVPEDRIFFSNQDGKKTVITIQLDLSDFDGSSVVYGVLLGRNYLENYRTPGAGPMMAFFETEPYYLCGADDLDDLMGWEE